MKKLSRIFMLLTVVAISFSCSNKETEARIAKLEGKVAELETRNGARQAATPTTPAAVTTEPEVAPEGPLPRFEFQETSFDFGTINDGDVVDHVFSFVNTGDAPLIITDASATCGCTVPVWPREPIPVGGKGEIKVQFNSRNKPGVQSKTVSITANTYPKINRLSIKANVNKANNPS